VSEDTRFYLGLSVVLIVFLGFFAFSIANNEANKTARWEACVAKSSAIECAAVLK